MGYFRKKKIKGGVEDMVFQGVLKKQNVEILGDKKTNLQG